MIPRLVLPHKRILKMKGSIYYGKIKSKFSRLNHVTDNYIYVGLLVTATGWSRRDYIDIMSYFDCVGFEKITEEEAKDFSVLPTGNYCEFLKLQRAI